MLQHGPEAVGLVLGRDQNFWVATEVLQRVKQKPVATGFSLSRQGLANFGSRPGRLGRDRGRLAGWCRDHHLPSARQQSA